MNRLELFAAVENWLKEATIEFLSEPDCGFRVCVSCDNALLNVRLLCEDDPTTVQVICPVPVRIPAAKVGATAILLHNLNRRLRLGAFQFHVEERIVEFRLAMLIRAESPLGEQFSQAISTTISTMDEHVRAIGLQACATPESQSELAKFLPREEEANAFLRLYGTRLDLN